MTRATRATALAYLVLILAGAFALLPILWIVGISLIVLIGAMVVLGHADTTLEKAIGFVAVLLGAGNAAGGYVVTERMLEMFKSSKKPAGKEDKA